MKQENETDIEINGMNHLHCSSCEHIEGSSVNGCFTCSVPVNSSEPCVSLIENPQLFYKKLSEFNKLNGLSLIASAASSVLDLYLFYKEVLMRGGFAQVTKDGRWHEVSSALNFSDISPEPSFLLQNLYANLLYNFELIYGIRAQEKLPTAQGSGDYRDQVGNKVPGVIEKEIECGYLISVTIGIEKLKGLLYHIKDPSVKQFALVRSLMDGVGLEDSAHQLVDWQDLVSSNKEEPILGSSSKEETKIKPLVKSTAKKECKEKDAPTATRNAYQFFLHWKCDRLKKKHGKNPNINFRQMATDAWKCLPERDRLPYIEESRKDKERFKREMLAYNVRKTMKNEESIRDGDRFKMLAYNERKAMKNVRAEVRIFDSEASMHEFHSNHHITIQTDKSSKLFMQNGSMVGFAAQLLENAPEIDAAVRIELADEFLSVP